MQQKISWDGDKLSNIVKKQKFRNSNVKMYDVLDITKKVYYAHIAHKSKFSRFSLFTCDWKHD